MTRTLLAFIALASAALAGPLIQDARLTGSATVAAAAAISFANTSQLVLPTGATFTLFGTSITTYAELRTAAGLAIGTNVQAYDADLTTYAGITPSANVQTLLAAADFAAMRTSLGLVIGTNVQAYDADLTTYAGITPSANVQTLLGSANFAAFRTSVLPAMAGQTLKVLRVNAGETDYELATLTPGAMATDAIWDAAGDLVQGTGANTAARLALGTAGQVLKVNGGATAVEWGTVAGTGDFVGPASSTDNAVVRFDLGTGKLGQNSVVIIGDTGNVTGLGTLNTHTIPGGTSTFATLGANNAFTGANSFTTGDGETTTIVNTSSDGSNSLSIDMTGISGSPGLAINLVGSLFYVQADGFLSAASFAVAGDSNFTGNLNLCLGSGKVATIGGGATASEFRFLEPSGSGTNYSSFSAQVQSANIDYKWPASIGTTGQVLAGTVSGTQRTLEWVTVGGSVATDAIFDAKGDLAVGTGADTSDKLAVGSNGKILEADSAQSTGLKWVTGGGAVQVVTASTAATASHTTAIPRDDTIPQSTEGSEALTVTITPTSASNKVRIDGVIHIARSTGNAIAYAIFRDSGADAIATFEIESAGVTQPFAAPIHFIDAPATTSAVTYKVRYGAASGTCYLNQSSTGRLYGGTTLTVLTATEVKP
ncbi:MAG: hypothetical protein ABMA13_18355 [Chthoniobacteraceae bacterium]